MDGQYTEERIYEDTHVKLSNLSYSTIHINPDEYPELSTTLDGWSANRKNELISLLDEYAALAIENTELLEECLNSEYAYMYGIYQNLRVQRADTQIISLLESTNMHTDQYNVQYTGLNFDTQTGQMLSLSDILEKEEDFYSAATDYMIEEIRNTNNQENLVAGYENAIANMWNRDVIWYMNGSGISIMFDYETEKEVICYDIYRNLYYGLSVTLPYTEFSEFLVEKYTNTQNNGVAKIIPNKECILQTPNETIKINLKTTEFETGFISSIILCVNETEIEIGDYGYVQSAYIIQKDDGKLFFIITCDYMSEDYVTLSYEIKDGTIHLCDELSRVGLTDGTINNESMTLSVYIDALGSYTSRTKYTLDENGKFCMMDDMYHFGGKGPAYSYYKLKTIKELPVVMGGVETLLPIGSQICITGTDNIGIITFYDANTGQSGEIHYERNEDEWEILINGCSEYDYFEVLPYAG